MKRLRIFRMAAAALTILLFAGCERVEQATASDFLVYEPKTRVHWIGRDLSRVVGERAYAEEMQALNTAGRIVANEKLKRRVNKIASRLVAQAVVLFPFSEAWDWELNIVKDEEPNASCYAGGKMVINSGFLTHKLFDDNKLATVLGHEIAHALLEHGRSSIGRGSVSSSVLYVVAQSFKMGVVRMSTLRESMATVTRPMDRQQEREADMLGMELMARAGFNPVLGAAIWRDMGGDVDSSTLARRFESYASSHPTSQERLLVLTQTAARLTRP